MRSGILTALEKIEKQHDVKVLYAIESGSRMWGVASENSDYDIRFIYVSRPDYYISVSKKRDCIEFTDKENDIDFSGWDLKKALGLLWKSNMSLYEWLRSPIVYRDSPHIHSFRKIAALMKIIEAKKSGEELSAGQPDAYVNAWAEKMLQYFSDLAETMPDRMRDISILDKYLYETVSQTWKM